MGVEKTVIGVTKASWGHLVPWARSLQQSLRDDDALGDGLGRLDAELARWLRTRATVRTERGREASSLDDVAMALRRVRATLTFVASSVTAARRSRPR